jgi:hypothetical protein
MSQIAASVTSYTGNSNIAAYSLSTASEGNCYHVDSRQERKNLLRAFPRVRCIFLLCTGIRHDSGVSDAMSQ